MALDDQILVDAFDDHPSLSASLEDFEHNAGDSDHGQAQPLNIPSHHSGFYESEEAESDLAESDSGGPWSPPIGARFDVRHAGGGLSGHQVYPKAVLSRGAYRGSSPARSSREASPQYEDAQEGDITLLPSIALRPASPVKRTSSSSPDPYPEGGKDFENRFGQSADAAKSGPLADNGNNFIRFAVRAEVQHRTEPFEAAFAYFRQKLDRITESRSSTVFAIVVALASLIFLRLIMQAPPPPPVPDLVKVAGLAKSFEPLIFYSENGVQQIGDLQETGVAVWDLGESVRSTNMTSAPLIVKELDDLSESLKTLAIELTKFFANVDGDVDGILIVMDWAKRELSQVSSLPLNSLTSVFDNLHSIFCRVGLFESQSGVPTGTGRVITELFGQSRPQRTRKTLHRTFTEFLSVLEESIEGELKYSMMLFGLFESIDRQFLNLARTVIRESDQQEREEGELLSSLWTRVLGPNAAALRKYEKNRKLLSNVREKTIRNKHIIVDHNGKLLTLKANLETLRKKLVSPLVRSNDSSTLSVEEQIKGLDGTYEHLRRVRERQKGKLMEMLYGAGNRRAGLSRGDENLGIDGGRGGGHDR
ncbi:MAG: hypothetical protein M1832_001126 [Thelocarpon impressellum]|nr:MAG: hypothetical protein M1832_001126 [Thelocarpon impressellum]